MRLLLVADLHYNLQQFDWLLGEAANYDLVVIAGDLLDLAGHTDLDTQIVVIQKYLARLRERAPLVVSSGNHDGDTKTSHDEFVAEWILGAGSDRLFVDNQSTSLGDTLITVCPWWDGPVTREAMTQFLVTEGAKQHRRWIWIHHAPPNDLPICWTGRKFAGDSNLNELIERLRPDFVVSGHIHNSPFYDEGSWIARAGSAWAFNPGAVFGPAPPHIILDLDAMTATWVSSYGIKEASVAAT